MSSNRTARRGWLLVGCAIVIGTILRLIGLGYGLPEIYNPDEVAIMNRAMGLAQNQFNPHNFLYPSLYFYALFIWEGVWFVMGRALGIFGSVAAFEHAFFTNPTSIYLAGRGLTVVCGVLTIWSTFTLGSRVAGSRTGVIAALLLAVAPLAVRDAHYVKHDVPVTWLIVLTHALLAQAVLSPPNARRWWPAAVVAGLAMSTHYYAVFLAVPLVLCASAPAVAGEASASRARRLIVIGAIAAAAFILGSPFLAMEPGTALRDVVANREIVMDRATAATGLFGSLGFYLTWLFRDGVGLITAVLATAGLVVTMLRGWRTAVVLLSFPIVFLLFIANTFPASRYLNPVVPFAAVLAGMTIDWLMSRSRVAGVALLLAAVAEGSTASLRADVFMRATDTRTLAQQWIEHNVPEGTGILVQPYSVPLRPTRAALTAALTANLGSASLASVKFQRQLALTPYPAPAYRPIFLGSGGLDVDKIYIAPSAFDGSEDLSPLRAHSVTYVVMKRYNTEDPSMAPISAALRRQGRLVAVFSPYRSEASDAQRAATPPFLHNSDVRMDAVLERPGPTIEIWTTN